MALTFEVAYGVAPGTDPTAGQWTDVSSRIIRPVTCRLGGEGWATLALDDTDGQLSPDVVGQVLMCPARLKWDGTDLWRGLVQSWQPVWAYGRAARSVRCVDALAWFAVIDVDVDLARQLTSDRINDVLDLAIWPAALRDIDSGRVWLSAYERDVVNVRQLLEDTADAEEGDFYVSADGLVTFRSRHSRLNATVDLDVYGAGHTGDVGAVNRVETPYNTDRVFTIARVELENGEAYERSKNTGQYGERDLPVRDLALPGYQAEALANWIVYRFSEPSVWLDSLPVHTDEDPASVLAVTPGSRVRLQHDTPSGSTETLSGHVESIRHEIDTGRFVTTLEVSPYFGEGPWLTLDDATLGKIGATAGNMIGP